MQRFFRINAEDFPLEREVRNKRGHNLPPTLRVAPVEHVQGVVREGERIARRLTPSGVRLLAPPQLVLDAQALPVQRRGALPELLLCDFVGEAQVQQALALAAVALHGPTQRHQLRGLLVGGPAQLLVQLLEPPLVELLGDAQRSQVLPKLLLQSPDFHERLWAVSPTVAVAVVVGVAVHVAVVLALHLFLSGDRGAAGSAADETGVGELVPGRPPGAAPLPQKHLDSLVLSATDQGLVGAAEPVTGARRVLELAAVERVGEDPVEDAVGDQAARAHAQPPFLVGSPSHLGWGHALQDQVEELPYERGSLGVPQDLAHPLGLVGVVEVSQGGEGGEPASLDFGADAPHHGFPLVVVFELRLRAHEREQELVGGAIGEVLRRRHDAPELPLVHEVDEEPRVRARSSIRDTIPRHRYRPGPLPARHRPDTLYALISHACGQPRDQQPPPTTYE